MIIKYLTLLIGISYLVITAYFKKYMSVLTFAVLSGLIFIMSQSIEDSVTLAVIISCLFILFEKKDKDNYEGFAVKEKKKRKNKKSKKKKDNYGSGNHVDLGTSFLEAYKSLSPDQIEAMTSDTKELLNTQKSLMKTLETLGPVVKEGKGILDQFKGYFDKDDI